MQETAADTRFHYDRFLARQYIWMAGGWEENCTKYRDLFTRAGIVPRGSRCAIDLGAGCGFGAIPLAEAGFRVMAVDFCRPLLAELLTQSENRPIDSVAADILDFQEWTGHRPELIVCLGDTLTHLKSPADVRLLIRQCYTELVPGGNLVLSLRDYSQELSGSVAVIPVRRDPDRLFLCRLEYGDNHVAVTDILFSRESGQWERTASTYTKIRIAPDTLATELAGIGFTLKNFSTDGGIITAVAQK